MRQFSLFALLSLLLAACAAAPQTTQIPPTLAVLPSPTPIASPTTADSPDSLAVLPTPGRQIRVRIIHAAPGLPDLNLSTPTAAIATNLAFGASTDPTPIAAGRYVMKVSLSGSLREAPPLLESALDLPDSDSLLLISGAPGALSLLVVPDKPIPLGSGESAIRLIHAVSGAPAITLKQGETALTTAAAYGQIVDTAALAPGSADLQIVGAGDALTIPNFRLNERINHILIFVGHADAPETLSTIVWDTPAPGRALLRLINGSTAISSMDVYLNDQPLATAVGFGRATAHQPVVSGTYMLNIYAAGDDPTQTEPAAARQIAFPADQHIAAVLLGSTGSLQIMSYNEDLSPTPSDSARIAFINTLEHFDLVQVETRTYPVADVYYGQPPQPRAIESAALDFYINAPNTDGPTVELVENVQTRPGFSYLYLITGQTTNEPFILSDSVGIDETLAVDVGDAGEQLARPATVRFVNALEQPAPLDFTADGAVLATAVASRSGTPLRELGQRYPVFGVRAAGAANDTVSLETTLETGGQYTVIAYGAGLEDLRLLLLPDSDLIFDGRSPHLRLINISTDASVMLGLGFSAASPAIENRPEGDSTDVSAYRRSIPFGVRRLANQVAASAASNVILMPVGAFNLDILDSALSQLAVTLSSVTLEANMHYDIFAYQETATPRIVAFVLPYPPRLG